MQSLRSTTTMELYLPQKKKLRFVIHMLIFNNFVKHIKQKFTGTECKYSHIITLNKRIIILDKLAHVMTYTSDAVSVLCLDAN